MVVGVASWLFVAYLVLGVIMSAIFRRLKARWTMTPATVLIAGRATIAARG